MGSFALVLFQQARKDSSHAAPSLCSATSRVCPPLSFQTTVFSPIWQPPLLCYPEAAVMWHRTRRSSARSHGSATAGHGNLGPPRCPQRRHRAEPPKMLPAAASRGTGLPAVPAAPDPPGAAAESSHGRSAPPRTARHFNNPAFKPEPHFLLLTREKAAFCSPAFDLPFKPRHAQRQLSGSAAVPGLGSLRLPPHGDMFKGDIYMQINRQIDTSVSP